MGCSGSKATSTAEVALDEKKDPPEEKKQEPDPPAGGGAAEPEPELLAAGKSQRHSGGALSGSSHGLFPHCFVNASKKRVDEVYDTSRMLELGHGGYGRVYMIYKRGTREKFALKENKSPPGVDSAKLFKEMAAEVDVQKNLDHPNIARVYDYFLPPASAAGQDAKMYIAMELLSGGNMLSRIDKLGVYSEEAAATGIEEVLHATAYCHSQGLVHRDIKLENFVYASKAAHAKLKMIDFGLAAMVNSKDIAIPHGTPPYMSPEAWTGKGCDAGVDMWAIGALTYMLLSGRRPFQRSDMRDIKKAVLNDPLRFPPAHWSRVSHHGVDFCTRLMQKAKAKRMTAVEALEHPWIKERSTIHHGTFDAEEDRAAFREVVNSLKAFGAKDQLARVSMEAIAFVTPPEKLQKLGEEFVMIDKDNSGTITLNEFREVMRGELGSTQKADELFAKIDCDHTNSIQYCEFIAAAMAHHYQRKQHMTLASAFALFDRDGKGRLSKTELTNMLGEVYPSAEIDEMIAQHGDADGFVSYHEFREMVLSDPDDERSFGMAGSIAARAYEQVAVVSSSCGVTNSGGPP